MENASKALIMAAVILISVVILSLGVYLFAYFGSYSKDVNDEIRNNQISQFNGQFLSYDGKIKPTYNEDGSFKKNVGGLTIYDVITLANLARNYNKDSEFKPGDKGFINITFSGTALNRFITTNPQIEGKNNLTNIDNSFKYDTNNNELLPYSCKIVIDEDIGMVSEIQISQ